VETRVVQHIGLHVPQCSLAWCQLKSISCVISGNSTTCGFVVTINDKVRQEQKRLQEVEYTLVGLLSRKMLIAFDSEGQSAYLNVIPIEFLTLYMNMTVLLDCPTTHLSIFHLFEIQCILISSIAFLWNTLRLLSIRKPVRIGKFQMVVPAIPTRWNERLVLIV
jgi:hypothetical protein